MLQKAPADVSRHIVGPKSFFSLDLNNETPVDKMQHYTHSNWPLCFLWFLQGSAAVTRNLQIVRWSYDLTSFCALFNPLFKKKKRKKKSELSSPPYRPVLMTSSVWGICSLFSFLTNENLSCFCVFLFFSVFFSLSCISWVVLDSDWGWGTTRPVTLSFHSIGWP